MERLADAQVGLQMQKLKVTAAVFRLCSGNVWPRRDSEFFLSAVFCNGDARGGQAAKRQK